MWLKNVSLAVNSTILYTQKFAKRVDLMVSVLITKTSNKMKIDARGFNGEERVLEEGDAS